MPNFGPTYHSTTYQHHGPGLWSLLFTGITAAVVGAAATAFFTVKMPSWLGLENPAKRDNPQVANDGAQQQRVDNVNDPKGSHGPKDTLNGFLLSDLDRIRLAGKWTFHTDGSYQWAQHAILMTTSGPEGTLVTASDTKWVPSSAQRVQSFAEPTSDSQPAPPPSPESAP